MKRIFVLVTVIISTVILMISIGANFAHGADKMMDKDMMMKHGDMMMEKGQMMMDKGKMMKEGSMDKDTMMKEGDMI
jgi:hypothetical protein